MAELREFLSGREVDYALLAKRIAEKRRATGVGLRDAAEQCGGISYSTLSRLERGSARPDLETLKRVVAWLGIAPSSLFMGSQPIRAHLRARKNLVSEVAAAVADAVRAIREDLDRRRHDDSMEAPYPDPADRFKRRLSSALREDLAIRFRETVKADLDAPLNPFKLQVKGACVEMIDAIPAIAPKTLDVLLKSHASYWSAATIPINDAESEWLIVLNSAHTKERQRATLMEEFCHILLGHSLTTLSHVEGQTFRDYDKSQEQDAFGLGAAILVPQPALLKRVKRSQSAEAIAKHFKVSKELVEFRIKVTGAWYDYKLKQHVTTDG